MAELDMAELDMADPEPVSEAALELSELDDELELDELELDDEPPPAELLEPHAATNIAVSIDAPTVMMTFLDRIYFLPVWTGGP